MQNVDNMEYNTTRNFLIMKEYGRHIQKMVEYLLTIQDKEERQRNAFAVIELMGFLNPHLKNVEDFRHKLWDHLFLISDFALDVESPYPIPTRETLKAKPEIQSPRQEYRSGDRQSTEGRKPGKKAGLCQCDRLLYEAYLQQLA